MYYDMTVKIPLTQGQVAIVCDCCAYLVNNKKWCAHWHSDTRQFYAVRGASLKERLLGYPLLILMHAEINRTPHGMYTDHKNNNTLDNRCENLRTATVAENNCNRKMRSNNTSGFKGVSWYACRNKWRAYAKVNNKQHFIGYYDSPEEAARAYDETARKLHGDFAKTNFS